MEIIKRDLHNSLALWQRATKVIHGGTQTASKNPDQFVYGVYPIYLQSGKGSHVFDVDGHEYIDFPCALGAIFLGHGYAPVVEAMQKQAQEGVIFSLIHPLEVELAELLVEAIPGADKVKFFKNGADATNAAVRIARAYTGREKIAFCGYHGWQDWFIISTEKNKGVPKVLKEHIHKFEYNKLETLQKIFEDNKDQIAAVIMEPMTFDEPKDNFLEKVKNLAHQQGALLIFDEMVTGFRFGLGGAQAHFGVIPDLSSFGKSVANGMPLSIIVGKEEIMSKTEDLFMSTTFGGEAVSLAAAVATIKEMKQKDVVRHIWKIGAKFKEGYNALAKNIGVNTESNGYPPLQRLFFKDAQGKISAEIKSLFLQETIKRGVLLGNVVIFNYSHTEEDIDQTLQACEAALRIIKEATDKGNVKDLIEGKLAGEVFRQKAQ